MSAGPSIFFKIGSKYDPKGMKDAESGIKGLANSVKSISTAIKGTLIFSALNQIKGLADKTTGAFIDQNKALTTLNKSLANNVKITQESAKRITQHINKIPRVFDDDKINSTAAMVANMGLAEDQIKAVMTAATDMASSGVTSLESAAKMLAQTYSGTSASVSKLVPDIKELTAEQLKNGDAVSMIAEKYKGYADEMSRSFSGRQGIFDNAIGNLKASIGGIFAGIKFNGQDKLIEPIQNLTAKIEEIRPKIINLFTNLPEVVKISLEAVKKIFSNIFTAEGINTLLTSFGEMMIKNFSNAVKFSISMFSVLGKAIKAFFENLGTGDLGKLCLNMLEKFTKTILTTLAQPIDILEALFKGEWSKAGKITLGVEKGTFGASITNWGGNNNNVDLTNSLNAMFDSLKDSTKTLIGDYKETQKDNFKNIKDFVKANTGTTLTELGGNIKEIMNRDVTDPLNETLGKIEKNTEESGTGTESEENKFNLGSGFKDAITGSLGELGNAINIFSSATNIFGGIISLAVEAVKDIISGLAESSENFNKTINFISTIVSGIVEGITDFIDFLFADIAEALTLIGKALGDILRPILKIFLGPAQIMFALFKSIAEVIYDLVEALSPLLEIIAEFVRLIALFNIPLQILIGWAKLLSAVLKPLANAMKWVYNAIYKILDSIALPTGISISWDGIDVKWKSLATLLGMSEMKDEEETSEDTATSGSGGSSASYTAQRDVYVDIYFNNSYVNGDARQISIMLAREIRSAEKLNLI